MEHRLKAERARTPPGLMVCDCRGSFTLPTLIMLSYTITFLVVALIAAALGFTGIAGTAAYIAKICFFIFLVLFIVSLFTGQKAG